MKLLLDQDATQFNEADEPGAAFTQEIAIMSALSGHPSIVELIGYTNGVKSSIVM